MTFLEVTTWKTLITVVNGRAELPDEVQNASKDVRKFIAENVQRLLANRRFIDSFPGHLMPDTDRTQIVLERLGKLANFDS